jgi:hypothetical protein
LRACRPDERIRDVIAENVDGQVRDATFVPKVEHVVATDLNRTGLNYLLAPVLIEKERGGILQHGVKLRNESEMLRRDERETTVCRPIVVTRDLNRERHDTAIRQFPGAVVARIHVRSRYAVDPLGVRRQEIVAP